MKKQLDIFNGFQSGQAFNQSTNCIERNMQHRFFNREKKQKKSETITVFQKSGKIKLKKKKKKLQACKPDSVSAEAVAIIYLFRKLPRGINLSTLQRRTSRPQMLVYVTFQLERFTRHEHYCL